MPNGVQGETLRRTQYLIVGLSRAVGREVEESSEQIRLADHDIRLRARADLPVIQVAEHAIVHGIGDVHMRRIGGGINNRASTHQGNVARNRKRETKFTAFNEVEGVVLKILLTQ